MVYVSGGMSSMMKLPSTSVKADKPPRVMMAPAMGLFSESSTTMPVSVPVVDWDGAVLSRGLKYSTSPATTTPLPVTV